MLKTRVITALVLLALVLPSLFFLPQAYWALLVALFIGVAAWEWGGLLGLDQPGRVHAGTLGERLRQARQSIGRVIFGQQFADKRRDIYLDLLKQDQIPILAESARRLARRGDNLWGHPHWRKLLEGQVYCTAPNGKATVSSGTWGGSAFSSQAMKQQPHP